MKAWCIRQGILLPYTVRSTRKQAIKDFVDRHNRYSKYPETIKEIGGKAVKVEVKEIK